MGQVLLTPTFQRWLGSLRDRRAIARINIRLREATEGRWGDAGPVGNGVFEMRIHYGPGYRLYFMPKGPSIIVLLCGGDKDSQQRDIRRAYALAQEWR